MLKFRITNFSSRMNFKDILKGYFERASVSLNKYLLMFNEIPLYIFHKLYVNFR